MARDWASVFNTWSQGPSQTELDKCTNAEAAIKKAIKASTALSNRSIRVFAQGSYRNRTNVRSDSDVDVSVLCSDTFYYDVANGVTLPTGTIDPATYGFPQYRDEVEAALRSYFGSGAVVRGNKAFDIHENTYRIASDVVACFDYRYYAYSGNLTWQSGTAFLPDQGGRIHNYPQQHYDNGVKKNDNTNRHFKRVVRIMKRLRNEMKDNHHSTADPMASFLLESLVWNVPNDQFMADGYREDVRRCIIHLFNGTRTDAECKEWTEVNGIKYLFRVTQPWNRQAVNDFLKAAWNYAEYTS